ncbi:MAG: histidine phosphatase family protein [Pseudomonadota bacterium]
MKLILLRHAKSAWDIPNQDDHDRALNRRGQEAATRMGHWLRANRHVPDVILTSTALRTQETVHRLAVDAPVDLRRDLYLADPTTLLAAIHSRTEATILLVGHNPGIAEAAARATRRAPNHPDFDRYPTCACTVIDARGGLPGAPLAFVVPRDLPA